MLFQWIMGLVAISALVVFLFSDKWTSKSRHSSYYDEVKKPKGKEPRYANIPDGSQNDEFFTKLNSR